MLQRFIPVYKTPWGRKKIMAYYEAALHSWPGTIESFAVVTRNGPTHIIAAGPLDAPPVLLLHGLGDTALLWRPLFADLSRRYRLYAPDIIGQPGRSAPTRLPYNGDAYGEWLQDLIDGLAVRSVDIVGLSLGGFLALRLDMVAPQRIRRAVLISPAGLAPVRWTSFMRLFRVGLLPTTSNVRRFMEQFGATVTDQAVEWACLISRHFIPAPPPPVFATAELRRVAAPVSILLGQYDLFFNVEAIVKRAQQYLSNLTTAEIIPEAGHNLVRERPQLVEEFVLRALEPSGARSA